MHVFKDMSDWKAWRADRFPEGATVGFVPTMGALHAGHGALIARARRECDVVVLSIFVNPTQFDNPTDLNAYPVTLDADLELAERLGCDYVILPDAGQMYPDQYRFKVSEADFSTELCGAHRPGHFDGVLTVVTKLLNLVRADKAYFGEKDHQQLSLVKDMAEAFFIPTKIVACQTVRDPDGLAMSSRNRRLSPAGRSRAALFPRLLASQQSVEQVRAGLVDAGFEVDYIEERDGRRYGAVVLEGVRLIDNVAT